MSATLRPSLALAARSGIMMLRLPATLVAVVAVPLVFLGSFLLMFGRPMAEVLGDDYIQYLLPTTVTQAMLFAAMGSSWAVGFDVVLGSFTRWRTLPMDLRAVVLGRMVLDLAKAVGALAVLIPAGFLLGFRFAGGTAAAILFVLLALSLAVVASAGFTLVGFLVKDPFAIPGAVMIVYVAASLLSTGFVPAERFPAWLQPAIRANPVSLVSEALRRSGEGDPGSVMLPLAVLAAAFVGLWAVGGVVMRGVGR